VQTIQVQEPGGPEVLSAVEVEDPRAGRGEVVVDVAASGVNFVDTYERSGLYPRPTPFVLGVEGAGTVTAVGPGVDDVAVGDRVAWADGRGSYAERVALPAARVVPVPDEVDDRTAAAVLLQGLTAHYLVRDTHPLAPGERCLVHAGAGGVGLLLVQIAKLLGAEVFTTVGSQEKAELVRAAGADHVILYRDEDFGDAVERVAGRRPLHVVYDGVGRATFARGLELLRPRGIMVTFGNASGPVDPVSPLALMRGGSLYLTRPTLGDHVATTGRLRDRARELFGWVAAGQVEVRVGVTLPLEQAAEAHRLLEGRATTGKVLLLPPA
jgi:NADPH2:quinone reductase